MPTQKYNEIVMLVHPLYDEFRIGYFDFKLIANGNKSYDDLSPSKQERYKLQKARFEARIKIKLGIYGETLLKYKNKPNTVILMFEPHQRGWGSFGIEELYDKYMVKFKEFCKKNFNQRFVISIYDDNKINPTNLFSENKIIDKKYMGNLSKEINLVAFGEYSNLCVFAWANKVKDKLESERYIVASKKILFDKSLEAGSIIKSDIPKERLILRKRLLSAESSSAEKKAVYGYSKEATRKTMKKTFNFKKGHKSLVK